MAASEEFCGHEALLSAKGVELGGGSYGIDEAAASSLHRKGKAMATSGCKAYTAMLDLNPGDELNAGRKNIGSPSVALTKKAKSEDCSALKSVLC